MYILRIAYNWKQQEKADDYVIATGETYSCIDFIDLAAKYCGFDLVWEGENENKKAINKKNNKVIVIVNPKYYRPAEVDLLLGDPKKAESCLNWKRKVDFPSLVEMMVNQWYKTIQKTIIGI